MFESAHSSSTKNKLPDEPTGRNSVKKFKRNLGLFLGNIARESYYKFGWVYFEWIFNLVDKLQKEK